MTVVNYYRHLSFCCASPYALQILCFSQIEGKTPLQQKDCNSLKVQMMVIIFSNKIFLN